MTEVQAPPIEGWMLLADRKRRKIKSRGAYKDLTGMNHSAQVRWEKGDGKLASEYAMLAPFIFDTEQPALEREAEPDVIPGIDTSPTGEESAAPIAPPVPPVPSLETILHDQQPEVLSMPPIFDESTESETDRQSNQSPVELVSGEELDDPEILGDLVVTPGSGLPTKVEYRLPGYHITNSELQTFKRCRRKWYLSYYRELGLILQDVTGARAIGTRLHLALAAYYSSRHEDPMTVLEHTIMEDFLTLQERGDVQGLEDLEKDAALARIMLEGYLEWIEVEGKDDGLEVIGDEVVVEETLGTAEQFNWDQDVILMGKMDLRLRRYVDGARFFLDHKSVGSLKEPLKTLHMSEQMLHYHLLEWLEMQRMAEAGATVEYARGGMYNMLRKVKRTARANPPFFDRVEVPHNVYELQSYWKRVWGEVLEIIALRKKLDAGEDHHMVAYPTPTGNCSWDCDFFSVCNLLDDGSDAERMLSDMYVKGGPHDYYLPFGEAAVAREEGTN